MSADEQDQAEALDDDRLPADLPPEEPLGAEAYGTTGAEERWDEPLEERLAREEPDVQPPPPSGFTLVEPDEGAHTDTEPDAVALAVGGDGERLDVGDLAAGDASSRDVGTEREDDLAPEEAALHIVDDDAL